MKKFLFVSLMLAISYFSMTQERFYIPEQFKNKAEIIEKPTEKFEYDCSETLPSFSDYMITENLIMGNTYYDLQSNAGIQNRFHVFEDGTMAVVFNFGTSFPYFPERGTGYNYFDGNDWEPYPSQRVESQRTGYPSYAPFGENGEIFCSHLADASDEGLLFEKRTNKGMGDWTEFLFQGPADFEDVLFPRMATSGVDNSIIHLICVTNSQEPYQGIEQALLYSRSLDGGLVWQPENVIIPEINSDYYNHFEPDTYEIIAKGDLVAILYGSKWQDLGLLKSTDGGSTFSKTLIWEHPYPFWTSGTPTDTFYCADGSHHLAFDSEGMVHVVFGINRTYSDPSGSWWFPLVDGLGYWNESRPTFSNAMNALNPYGGAGSELVEDYSLIGWAQDINNNGEWDVLGQSGRYYVGISSQPQISINEEDEILVIYSSVTETYNNGVQDFRHLWARYSPNGEFWGPFFHLTSGNQFIFNEFVFPATSGSFEMGIGGGMEFYYACQMDTEPGMAVRGDLDPWGENLILYPDFTVGTGHYKFDPPSKDWMQIAPNPCGKSANIQAEIMEAGNYRLSVVSHTGTEVISTGILKLKPGINQLNQDVSSLSPGVYFVWLKGENNSINNKLIVK